MNSYKKKANLGWIRLAYYTLLCFTYNYYVFRDSEGQY